MTSGQTRLARAPLCISVVSAGAVLPPTHALASIVHSAFTSLEPLAESRLRRLIGALITSAHSNRSTWPPEPHVALVMRDLQKRVARYSAHEAASCGLWSLRSTPSARSHEQRQRTACARKAACLLSMQVSCAAAPKQVDYRHEMKCELAIHKRLDRRSLRSNDHTQGRAVHDAEVAHTHTQRAKQQQQ